MLSEDVKQCQKIINITLTNPAFSNQNKVYYIKREQERLVAINVEVGRAIIANIELIRELRKSC